MDISVASETVNLYGASIGSTQQQVSRLTQRRKEKYADMVKR